MPKLILTLALLIFIQHSILSQQLTAKDSLALKIPDHLTYTTSGISSYIKNNFSADTERIRAIFVWVANNINYDVDKLLAKNNPTGRQPVEDVLKTRRAVCGGYTDLFNELSTQCNIKSVVVSGYTKQQEKVVNISHAWIAAELNHTWYMYDPTWAAGYINNNTFTKKFSTIYYRVLPAELIKSHMPFDPMYQFMNYTLSNKEFIEGKNTTKAKLVFNFADTLQQYGLLSKDDKVISEARRIKSNGIENDVIQSRLDYLDKQKQAFSSKNGYQQAMDLYGRAVTLFNQYIALKNQQFNTVKEEKEIKQMVDSMSYYISESWSLLGTVVATRPENRQAVAGAYQSLEKFQNQVNKEKEFVTAYLGAGKSSRSQLFLTNRH